MGSFVEGQRRDDAVAREAGPSPPQRPSRAQAAAATGQRDAQPNEEHGRDVVGEGSWFEVAPRAKLARDRSSRNPLGNTFAVGPVPRGLTSSLRVLQFLQQLDEQQTRGEARHPGIVLSGNPQQDKVACLLEAGMVLYATAKWDAAHRRFVECGEDHPIALAYLGLVALHHKRHAAAAHRFGKALALGLDREALDHNNPHAQFCLAIAALLGHWRGAAGGGDNDGDGEAVQLLRRAAEQGHAAAMHELGIRLAARQDTREEGEVWIQRARRSGYVIRASEWDKPLEEFAASSQRRPESREEGEAEEEGQHRRKRKRQHNHEGRAEAPCL